MARNSYYDTSSDPFQDSSFIVPIQSSNSSQGNNSLALGASSLSLAHSPSSTRNYRYSTSVEQGDYRGGPSPATSYASMHSTGFDELANTTAGGGHSGHNAAAGSSSRSSRQVTRQPSFGQLGTPGGGATGVSRSISIGNNLGGGGAGHHSSSSRATSSNRMAYSPNPSNDHGAQQQQSGINSVWNSPRTDSLGGAGGATTGGGGGHHHSNSSVQQHYRASPSSSSSGFPPQANPMRRGLSYDGGMSSPSRQHLQQQAAPPPLQTASLLPTSYAGRAPAQPPYSPMTGVQGSGYGGNSPSQFPPGSPSSSSSHHFQQHVPSAGAPPPPSGAGAGGASSSSSDHNRHASYSPSHYAAHSNAPPPSSVYGAGNAASSFYGQHMSAAGGPPLLPSTSTSPNPPPPSHTPAHQPQAQQYYQSQQYFDSTLKRNSASTSAIPTSAQVQPPPHPPSASMYYAAGQDLRNQMPPASAPPIAGVQQGRSRGLRRVRDSREINRVVNVQPAGRRADPAGGFVSVRYSYRAFIVVFFSPRQSADDSSCRLRFALGSRSRRSRHIFLKRTTSSTPISATRRA